MKIKKIINNNVVATLDDFDNELVVMGRGIGFQKHEGDVIDKKKVEKYFAMSNVNASQFEKLVKEIPYETIKTADEIITYAKKELKRELNKNIYITVTDHLNFAIERHKNNINFQNDLLWEIKRFYQKEYQIGCHALEIIKEQLGIELLEDEAGFFALHIVNAEMNGDMQQSIKAPKIIKDVVRIVTYYFNEEIDESTLAYERFITHMKFFIQRAVKNEMYPPEDGEFCKIVFNRYKKAYNCAQKIREYIWLKLKYDVPDAEMMYLTIHIERVFGKE